MKQKTSSKKSSSKDKMTTPTQNKATQKNTSVNKGSDIIQLILKDHKPIKDLIVILKDPDVSFSKKRPAFEKFAPVLTVHAKSEEESLYVEMKKNKGLRTEAHEGDTEHSIVDQLVQEIKLLTGNEDKWMAKVKVLAELVEHHVKEEESKMLKEVKKEFSAEDRELIGSDYTRLFNLHESQQQKEKVADVKQPKNQSSVWVPNEKVEKHKDFYR